MLDQLQIESRDARRGVSAQLDRLEQSTRLELERLGRKPDDRRDER